jgi:hypothetical protein
MECLWVYDIERHFQQYFCYIMSVSFSGGSNPEKTTVLPKLTDKLYHIQNTKQKYFEVKNG